MVVVYTVEVVISTDEVRKSKDVVTELVPFLPVVAELTLVCERTDVLIEPPLPVDAEVGCCDEVVAGLELESEVGFWVLAKDVVEESSMLLVFVDLADEDLTEEVDPRLIESLETVAVDSLIDVGWTEVSVVRALLVVGSAEVVEVEEVELDSLTEVDWTEEVEPRLTVVCLVDVVSSEEVEPEALVSCLVEVGVAEEVDVEALVDCSVCVGFVEMVVLELSIVVEVETEPLELDCLEEVGKTEEAELVLVVLMLVELVLVELVLVELVLVELVLVELVLVDVEADVSLVEEVVLVLLALVVVGFPSLSVK
jgi:hypothetical protein